jgi:hypothetical protein
MSAWVGVAPLIGAGSLDGFAIGAMASGAFFLAITALRRGRKRYALAVSDGPGPRDGWLCEHVMAAEAFPAYAERLAQPDIPGLQPRGQEGMVGAASQAAMLSSGVAQGGGVDSVGQEGLPSPVGQEGLPSPVGQDLSFDSLDQAGPDLRPMFPTGRDRRTGGSHRSRHRRLGDPIPGSASPGRGSTGGAGAGGAGAPRGAASPEDLLPAGTSRHAAFPDSALHDSASPGSAHRLPELVFPDDTFGASKRPEVRRLPRHAAPGTSLTRRLSTGMRSLATSLTATRALIGGAHG